MNKEQNIEVAQASTETTATKKSFPSRTLLISLLAGVIVLALLATVLGIFAFVDFDKDGGTGNGGTTGGFSYRDSVITDYIALTEAMITGKVIPGFDDRVDEVTDENVRLYINRVLLEAALAAAKDAGTNRIKKTVKIDYADQVYLYIVKVVNQATGEEVTVDYFNNAYSSAAPVQIGMQTFGEAFDDALMGLIPKDTGTFETRTMGAVNADDVILFTFTVTETIPSEEEGGEDTTKTHQNATAKRIDLATASDEFRAAVLANYGAIGQVFSFKITEDADDDGDVEEVEYEGAISAVVENEALYPLLGIKLPDDYFGRNPGDEDYAALNGAVLDFYINIDYSVPIEANTYENMTISDVVDTLIPALETAVGKDEGALTIPSDKLKEAAAAREYCLATVKSELLSSYDEMVRSVKVSLIWEHLYENLVFDKLPEEEVKKYKDYATEQLEYYFDYYTSSDSTFAGAYPNIELFAPDFFGYDKTEYATYEDFATYYAESTVKQQLLIFGIYNSFINDEAKLSVEYEKLVAEAIEVYTTTDQSTGEKVVPTREQIISYVTEDYLRDSAITELVADYLLEKNQVDFTLQK